MAYPSKFPIQEPYHSLYHHSKVIFHTINLNCLLAGVTNGCNTQAMCDFTGFRILVVCKEVVNIKEILHVSRKNKVGYDCKTPE